MIFQFSWLSGPEVAFCQSLSIGPVFGHILQQDAGGRGLPVSAILGQEPQLVVSNLELEQFMICNILAVLFKEMLSTGSIGSFIT